MTRLLTRLLAGFLLTCTAGVAWTHPLGNFTTNRQARVTIASDRVQVRYVVDVAEIPTHRMLAELDANGWSARMADGVARDLRVSLDGQSVALRPETHAATLQAGAAGLPTLRIEVGLAAPLATSSGTLVVRDDGFEGLPGWQEIVADAGTGVALGSSTASTVDRTDGLRTYPTDLLTAPPQMREARIAFEAGAAPTGASLPVTLRSDAERFGDRLTALVSDPTPLSAGVILSALLAAAVLGAFHALTPGHGKTIVGAYLVGTRGTWKHAVFLGLVVTATHTAGVYLLGAATLAASAWIVPERLLPWLSVASGVLVLAVGTSLVPQRLEAALHGHHDHDHDHDHHHHDHEHGPHTHTHLPPADSKPSLRNLAALGVSGGLLPCPSALVVMLGAIALGRTAFGLALILAFSVGLAAVLTAIGLALVYARRTFDRLPIDGRFARFAPVASAAIISLAGLAIVVEAVLRMGA